MFAIRCKPRWPGRVEYLGPSYTYSARPIAKGPPSAHLIIRGSCLGTSASLEARNDEHGRHGLVHRKHSFYMPRAYAPLDLSYIAILYRAIVPPVRHARQILSHLHRALQPHIQEPGGCPRPQPAPADPREVPLPLEHVLDRSLHNLTKHSERIQQVLSAIAEDVSRQTISTVRGLPLAPTHDHHLSKWYTRTLAVIKERPQIEQYLSHIERATETADRIAYSNFRWSLPIDESLNSSRAAVKNAVHEHRHEISHVIYGLVRNLKEFRRAQRWRDVWRLERKLALATPMLLKPHSLATAFRVSSKKDNERITEISMSRMAEWNESWAQIYEEDVATRAEMDIRESYVKVCNAVLLEKPWHGRAVVFTVRPVTESNRERIVIRYDMPGTPSPLWPHVLSTSSTFVDGKEPALL